VVLKTGNQIYPRLLKSSQVLLRKKYIYNYKINATGTYQKNHFGLGYLNLLTGH
jgi:hypothetical protein